MNPITFVGAACCANAAIVNKTAIAVQTSILLFISFFAPPDSSHGIA
jgi:hypothetical protein